MPDAHLALVTGAGKRLGRVIALSLAKAGCDVAVHFRSSREEAESACEDIRKLGRTAHPVGFDQADEGQIARGFAEIATMFGRAPDVLVNSASMFEWDDIATVTQAGLAKHAQANLFGPVLLVRKMFEGSSESTRGLIVNMLDQKLFNPNPDHLSYTLSKYALQGFTTMMARRLAPRFRVCGIAPGYTLPDVGGETDGRFEKKHDATPLHRGPTPDDIGGAIAYLLNAPAITSQTLIVDGGSHMRPMARDFGFDD
jgi:NAD(P)-dependent dehydrogenase (short-subunit alcohol dehydrogenase family)